MAVKQWFLKYYSDSDAIGTKVSVRHRRSCRSSEVVVKRGSLDMYMYVYVYVF